MPEGSINHGEGGAETKDQAAAIDRIVCSGATKSDRIRKLDELGLKRADIARALGVRYQFVRNVLVDDERRRTSVKEDPARYAASSAARKPGASTNDEKEPKEMAVSDSSKSHSPSTGGLPSVRTTLMPGGQLTIPEPFLPALGIEDGDAVFLELAGDELRLYGRATAIRQVQELVAKYVPPDVSLVDAIIAERRRESRGEDDHA